MIEMTELQKLVVRAKESFDIAAAMDAFKPEGIAVQMKSGLILTGYTQPFADGNAAKDALRSVIPCFPTEDNPQRKVLDHFTIASVVLVTGTRGAKVSDSILRVFRGYPAFTNDAQLYVASPKSTGLSPPPILSVRCFDNQL